MVRGVVFDFDGTLAETRDAVASTVNAALRGAGLPRVAPAWVHGMMGLPLETLLLKAIPRTQRPDDLSSLVAAYRDGFAEHGLPHVRPMPEADAVLRALAEEGRVLAIATSREASTLDPILAGFGWSDRFASIATCDRVTAGKPAPDLLRLALDEAGLSSGEAVLVGDTRWDMEMAGAAGVRAVGVTHGSHGADDLRAAGAAAVLDDLRGVAAVLAQP